MLRKQWSYLFIRCRSVNAEVPDFWGGLDTPCVFIRGAAVAAIVAVLGDVSECYT